MSRSKCLVEATCDLSIMEKQAKILLAQETCKHPGGLSLRLLGVRMSQLCQGGGKQMTLRAMFDKTHPKENHSRENDANNPNESNSHALPDDSSESKANISAGEIEIYLKSDIMMP